MDRAAWQATATGSWRVGHNWLSMQAILTLEGEALISFTSELINWDSWFVLGIGACIYILALVARLVKNPPAMQETLVQFLGWEDPWTREGLPTPVFFPGEFHGLYSPWGCKESDTTKPLSLSYTSYKPHLFIHSFNQHLCTTCQRLLHETNDLLVCFSHLTHLRSTCFGV